MTLGDGIDGTVRRIERGYDVRGLMSWVSSHDDPQEGSGSVLNEVKFSHNAFNQLIEDIQSHGYDGLGQVVSAQQGNLNINRTAIGGVPAEGESFQYDPIGNWRHYQRKEDGLSVLDQPRENNTDNQIVSLDHLSTGIGYDASGNMTATRPDKEADWGKGYLMVWDAWNRLVEVKDAQTEAQVARYAYDGLARRVTREVGGVVHHDFYNDAWKQVEERLDTATTPANLYYWSLRKGHRDELLRRDRDTNGSGDLDESLYCVMDYYDPIAITDDTGGVVERYDYSAFGLVQVQDVEFEPRAASEFAWNFLFHGRFRDTETGWDNYGYRYFLPELGRWASRDPIEEEGGINIYCFSLNSPVDNIDPDGRWVWPAAIALAIEEGYRALGNCPQEWECKEGCENCCSVAAVGLIASIQAGYATSLATICAPLAASLWGALACIAVFTAIMSSALVNAGNAIETCKSSCENKKSKSPPDCCRED